MHACCQMGIAYPHRGGHAAAVVARQAQEAQQMDLGQK